MVFSVKSASPIILLFAVLLSISAYAQPDDPYLQESLAPAEVDQSAWDEAIEERSYIEKASKKKKAESVDLPDFDKPDVDFSWLVYVAILAALALITWLLVKLLSGKSNVRIKQSVLHIESIEDLEDDLQEADLESLLSKALREKQFKLALRIRYLITLRDMEEVQWIDYRKDKTNLDYVREMNANAELHQFKVLTRIFDFVWYGDLPFGEEEFRQVNMRFETYLQVVRNHGA